MDTKGVIQPMIRGKINPSNEDIITCIEQELQLLDAANGDIGNRMDQVSKSSIYLSINLVILLVSIFIICHYMLFLSSSS